jgi:predicted dehydrogenase
MTVSADQQSSVRCGVIGVGRMGRQHVRVYAQNPKADLVGVVDIDPHRRSEAIEEWGGEAFSSADDLLAAGVDAVSIATPTVHHRAAAEHLLSAGVACLIEKPLAPDLEQARAIAEAARRSGAALQVGHIVRYDPVMKAIAGLDLSPVRFVEIDRISPMTFRSVDVGVVLDMMIHDLDLLLMITGNEPQELQANAACVLGDREDVCNARLTFPPDVDGIRCVANLTASRLALKTERKIRLITDDAYVSADFVERRGTVVRKTANAEQLEEIRRRLRAGEDLSEVNYLELVEVDPLEVEAGEPLALQIDDFLCAVREKRQPTVDARAGFAAVRTAERIVTVAREAGARTV